MGKKKDGQSHLTALLSTAVGKQLALEVAKIVTAARNIDQLINDLSPETHLEAHTTVMHDIERIANLNAVSQEVDDTAASGKRKKRKRDPNAPKRPLASYLLFVKDHYQQLAESNSGVAPKEMMSKLGELWRELPEEEKTPYMAQAAEARNKYNVELEAYKHTVTEDHPDDEQTPTKKKSLKSAVAKKKDAAVTQGQDAAGSAAVQRPKKIKRMEAEEALLQFPGESPEFDQEDQENEHQDDSPEVGMAVDENEVGQDHGEEVEKEVEGEETEEEEDDEEDEEGTDDDEEDEDDDDEESEEEEEETQQQIPEPVKKPVAKPSASAAKFKVGSPALAHSTPKTATTPTVPLKVKPLLNPKADHQPMGPKPKASAKPAQHGATNVNDAAAVKRKMAKTSDSSHPNVMSSPRAADATNGSTKRSLSSGHDKLPSGSAPSKPATGMAPIASTPIEKRPKSKMNLTPSDMHSKADKRPKVK